MAERPVIMVVDDEPAALAATAWRRERNAKTE